MGCPSLRSRIISATRCTAPRSSLCAPGPRFAEPMWRAARMANDPMDALGLPLVPIEPRPEFVALLRRRVHEGLGLPLLTSESELAMTQTATRPSVTPALHYRDATHAVRWLIDTLGLEQAWVYPEAGPVQHAELRWGSGVVLISYKRGTYEDRGP